jgi:hypothetical protein
MSIFSLNWFKSKKQREIDELKHRIEIEKLENKLRETIVEEKPYKKVKLVNNVLTVVMHDGSILTKTKATPEDFKAVREAVTEMAVLNAMISPEVLQEKQKVEAEIKRVKALTEGVEVLKNLNDFDVQENVVYLKGINRTLPQILVEEFIQIVQEVKTNSTGNLEQDLAEHEKYQSLRRFFMWCCLNPRAEVADELYRFLKENSFRITKQGFFVALRNVVTLRKDNELIQFVSNSYNKIKAVWKKNPAVFEVYNRLGEYKLINTEKHVGPLENEHWTHVGNLKELYLELPNMAENRFTDDWTKTFDIRVGKVVNMPMEQCNWSTQDCAAAGLHFTADQIHYVGCGDQSVLVLINPMKVVGIGQHKGRCYEYLPIMTVPREEATQILHDLDFDTLELDEDYAVRELENLAEKVKEGFAEEAKKHAFNIPQISTTEIYKIVFSLEEMKASIDERVVSLD